MVAKVVIPTIPTSMPLNAIVRTGSYTVPAGQHAYVTANVHNGGTFTINAAVALRTTAAPAESPARTAVNIASGNNTTILSFTVPANRFFRGYYHQSAGGTSQRITVGGVNQVHTGGGINSSGELIAGTGQVVSFIAGATSIRSFSGYTEQTIASLTNTSASGSFWVPTGTIMNKTGTGEYVTMNYNN